MAVTLICATGVVFGVGDASAQESRTTSLAGDAAIEAARVQQENLPYTFKSGDFRLLVTPSLGLDYNDNINVSRYDALDDFILRPMLQLNASYPITRGNLLQLDVGVGYDQYFNHNNYSGPRLTSGSQLSFDAFVKDFKFNLHDRFQYTSDAAGQAAIANNSRYEYFQNTVGLSVDWDLRDVILSAGYDHLNYISQSDQYEFTTHSSEMFNARAGLKVRPTITAGIEGLVSLTSYDQPVLNDYIGYSGGVYAEWHPSSFLSIQPRVGYSFYDFDQTSFFILAENQSSWYADITLRHAITEVITYSLSAGHELRPGIQADMIDDWYARPGVTWGIFKDISLNTGFSYEHGKQSSQGLFGAGDEAYDYLGWTLGVTYSPTKRLQASLNYRYTLRTSDIASREYTQNIVGIQLTYLAR